MGAFNVFKSKKQKKVHQLTAEEYYIKLGNRTKTATVLLAVALAVMVIFAISAYSDDITVDNLRYMLKFINTENAAVSENDVISFDSDAGNRGNIISGNLVVYNSEGISVYDNSGEKLQSDTFRTDCGVSVAGDRYMYYYDLGGSELRAYTAYQKTYVENFDYPILGLAASDNNYFAVISSVKGYRSAVMVYNSYFKVIYTRKFGEYYVNSVDISHNGKSFTAAVMYSDDGLINAGVYLFSVEDEEPLAFASYPGEIPITVKYLQNGFALLTDSALRFYDETGAVTSETLLGDLDMNGYVFGDDCCALFCGTKGLSTGTYMICIGSDGKTINEHTFDVSLMDKVFADGDLYVLTYGELYRFGSDSGEAEKTAVDGSYRELVADSELLLLFSNDSAVIYKTFDEDKEQ